MQAFYHAAQASSFTNTKMNLSSSVISRHVSDLEKQFEVKLFFRTKSGLVLSKEGDILYERTDFILKYLDETKKHFIQSKEDPRQNLTAFFPTSWGLRLLLPHLNQFLEENPGLRVSVITDQKKPSFTKERLEVALLPYVPEDKSLIRLFLTSVNLKLYASSDYIKKHGEPKNLKDLDKHRMLSSTKGDKEVADLDWHLKIGLPDGQQRVPFLRVSEAYYSAVEGIGIVSLASENLLLKEKKLVNILPDVKGPTVSLYLCYSEHLRGTKSIKAFSEYLKEVIKKLEDSFK